MSKTGYDRLGSGSSTLLAGRVCGQYTTVFLALAGALLVGRLIHPAAAAVILFSALILSIRKPLVETLVCENSGAFEDMASYLMIMMGIIALAVMLL